MATAIILPRTSIVIAPADATASIRRKADIKCSGTDDQEINTALASVARDGVVSLLRGTFRIGGPTSGGIQHPGQCMLEGTGWDTIIEMGDSNGESLVSSSPLKHLISPSSPASATREFVRIQNLKLKGRASAQNGGGPIGLSGAKHGVALLNAPYARVENVWAEDFDGDGIYVGTPQTATFLFDIPGVIIRGCVVTENYRNGMMVANGNGVLITENTFMRNQRGVAPYLISGASVFYYDFEATTHSFTATNAAGTSSTTWGYQSGRSYLLTATAANATATRSTTIPATLHRIQARVQNGTESVRTVQMTYNGSIIAGPMKLLPNADTTIQADVTGTGAAADLTIVWTDSVSGDTLFADQIRCDPLITNPKYDTNVYASAEIDVEPNLFSIGHQRAREVKIIRNRFVEGRFNGISVTRPGYDTSRIEILDNYFRDCAEAQISHNSRSSDFSVIAGNRFIFTNPTMGKYHVYSHGPSDLTLRDNIFEGAGIVNANFYAVVINSDGGVGIPNRTIIRGNKFDLRNANSQFGNQATVSLRDGLDNFWGGDNRFVGGWGYVDSREMLTTESRTMNVYVADNLMTITIPTFPPRTVIERVTLQVVEAFSGSGAETLIVGTAADTDGLIEAVNLDTIGVKVITGVLRDYQAAALDLIALVTSSGSAPTGGKALISITHRVTGMVT